MDHGPSGGRVISTTFLISNLHCSTCITSIESSLSVLQPPPNSISYSIISHSTTVRHEEQLTVPTITSALEQAGFEVYSVVVHGQGDGGVSPHPSIRGSPDQLKRASSASDWGLEAAVQRWTQSRRDGTANESRKRKRHMEQCKQCQEEITAPPSSPSPPTSRGSSFACMEKNALTVTRRSMQSDSEKAQEHEGSACYAGQKAPPLVVVDEQEKPLFQASFTVAGMTCSACVGNVSRVVTQIPSVKEVNVGLLSNSATVTFYGAGTEDKIVEAVEDAGYDVSLEELKELDSPRKSTLAGREADDVWKASYTIGGMTCSACVSAITNGLKDPDWIVSVDVNLISNSATITFRGKEHAEEIREMIEDLGYDASWSDLHSLSADKALPATRKVVLQVKGMYCHHCPARILRAVHDTYGDGVQIERPLSEKDPLLGISYEPSVPDFTLRQIVATIGAVDPEIEVSVYHAPTIEQRSQQIHAREKHRILIRLALSTAVAIPTFIIGIVYMSLVGSTNRSRRYLMEPMWAGRVSRAEWALFIMGSVVYFFAADMFHIRTIEGVRIMWRRGSPVPIRERFYRFGSMNMLITIGTSIAYFSSIAALAINATVSSSSSDGSTSYYFDSVVFLTMFLLAGRFLEAYSKAKTGDAVASLGRLRPSEALLISGRGSGDNDGSSGNDLSEDAVSTPIDMLEIGDTLLIPHGASPPFDGLLLPPASQQTVAAAAAAAATTGTGTGTGTGIRFDESSLTGESRPVPKNPNDPIYAGTINKGGPVAMRLTSNNGTSLLDGIIAAVRQGQTRRAPVERVADTVTAHFVPCIVGVGITTWVVWLVLGVSGALPRAYLDGSAEAATTTATGGWPFWALQFAIAVFVVACPCGIGLAGPTALFVGGGLAAKHGILVKGGGEAFQEASMLDVVVFDKTGTLTVGAMPTVGGFTTYNLESTAGGEHVGLGIARALEGTSSHPVAAAVVAFCAAKGAASVTVYDVEEIAGKGIKGRVGGGGESPATYTAIIGNEALMTEHGVDVATTAQVELDGWKRQGMSIALLALRKEEEKEEKKEEKKESSMAGFSFTLTAAFAISDPIRPEAAGIVQTLQHSGLSVWLLSGDNEITANAVGAQVGIPSSNIVAGVLPEQKADKIKYLQRTLQSRRRGWLKGSGRTGRATVAMVGDGINDAPALATADVGIAIGSGSDVAVSTASFVLITSDLGALVTLIQLSRAVFRRVWFNFGWALVYNLIALPVAAGVLYPVRSGGSHVRLDPVWASLAMALSSVSVVTSSLLLRTRIPGVGFRGARK